MSSFLLMKTITLKTKKMVFLMVINWIKQFTRNSFFNVFDRNRISNRKKFKHTKQNKKKKTLCLVKSIRSFLACLESKIKLVDFPIPHIERMLVVIYAILKSKNPSLLSDIYQDLISCCDECDV